jgi:hypothetical protein
MTSHTSDSANVLNTKPLLLDPINNRLPEDIVSKINNLICDEYIKRIYEALEKNLIKNTIKIFLNDKKLSKFLYYYGYQTYYFNNQMYHYYNITTPDLGIYGEILSNLEWGDFECDTLLEDFKGIHKDTKEPYILNMPNDVIFEHDNINTNNTQMDFYKFDVNIYSKILTLNETLWILKNYSDYDTKILHDINECDYDTGVSGVSDVSDVSDINSSTTIANFEINSNDTYENIYDYDKEEFAIVWNLFNRGFIKLNIFKIIYIFCYHTDIDNTLQQYYNIIGGTGQANICVDKPKLFHKTCFNVIKYFNKKIKKAVNDSNIISYLYAIYADDEGIEFNDEHEEYENKAYDILHDNGLLKTKSENTTDILDLLYVLYLK